MRPRRRRWPGWPCASAAATLARSPQLVFASVERRRELRHDLALRSAEEVAEELGTMKGALMKLGQMASYLDEGMPETGPRAPWRGSSTTRRR